MLRIKHIGTMAAQWFKAHEHHLSTAAFVLGFAWDQLTLTRIDLWLDNVLLIAYLAIALLCIGALNAPEHWISRHRTFAAFAKACPAILQFVFGGLFSGFFVFYSRSASLASSWPFLLFLLGLLVGNEFFRARYARFIFQISIFFITLFSYTVFAVPVLLGDMGPRVFVLSGLTSLGVMVVVAAGFWVTAAHSLRKKWPVFVGSIVGIYAAFNLMYFTNILPPIPLSLKELGVYHSVVRASGGYRVTYEKLPGIVLAGGDWARTFHRAGNEPVFVYSAVFAPTDLKIKILHRWAYKDEKSGAWITTDQLGFPIAGGRDGGWRGFTFKKNVFPGDWRAEVITERGQVLGRATFRVVASDTFPVLENAVR